MPLDALLLWFSERPDPPRLSRGRVETCHNTAAAEGTVAN